MIRVRITTEIIVIALRLLGLAKRLHPKLFATFRAVLLDAIQPPAALSGTGREKGQRAMNEALTEIMREYASDGGDPEIAQKARAELKRYKLIEVAARDLVQALPGKHFGDQLMRLRRLLDARA